MLKYIFPFLLTLSACSETKNNEASKSQPEQIVLKFENEVDMNNRMVEIDALSNQTQQVATSLSYSKSDGSSVKVLAYLNKQDEILKIEEHFSDAKTQTSGILVYYLNNGIPFMTKEMLDQPVQGSEAHEFMDRISYYDAKGEVIKTKQRASAYQEDAEKMTYTAVAKHKVDISRAMRALKAEKEFATTFQGFAYQEALTYLIVGENKEDGYTSTLKCDFKDQLLSELGKHPEKQIGRLLQVTFVVEEDQGYEYQVYTGGRFVK